MKKKTILLLNHFIIRHRLLIFLITLLALLVAVPLVHKHLVVYQISIEILFSLTVTAGIYIVSANRELLTIAVLLAIMTITIIWFNLMLQNLPLLIFGLVLEIIFFILTTTVIMSHVLSYRRVTTDKIYGAICGYLLMGMIFAMAYTLIETMEPGAFSFTTPVETSYLQIVSYQRYFSHFLYYSFVTITTLGYGDITPINAFARTLTSLEAMLGQLYVAVLIARLVGLHIAHTIAKK